MIVLSLLEDSNTILYAKSAADASSFDVAAKREHIYQVCIYNVAGNHINLHF